VTAHSLDCPKAKAEWWIIPLQTLDALLEKFDIGAFELAFGCVACESRITTCREDKTQTTLDFLYKTIPTAQLEMVKNAESEFDCWSGTMQNLVHFEKTLGMPVVINTKFLETNDQKGEQDDFVYHGDWNFVKLDPKSP